MGTRMCGNVGAVDKEKTSLHVLNVRQTFQFAWPGPNFQGRTIFTEKNGSWGDHFSNEKLGPGDQNFQDQNSGDSSSWSELLSQHIATICYTLVSHPRSHAFTAPTLFGHYHHYCTCAVTRRTHASMPLCCTATKLDSVDCDMYVADI